MLVSLISLLLLFLPGYSLLHIKWIQKKIDFSEIDKFLFGFIIWIFYIVSTILIANIIFPNYLKYVFWFNYLLGFILVGYWLFTEIPRVSFNLSNYQVKINLMDITLGGTLPFLLPMIAFVVVITLYTPLIYQYDALALYLIEGRQLIDGSSSLVGTWPTFGDSMPVMPLIYSWFFHLSDTPLLRLIPLSFFFLTIFLVYAMARKLSPRNPNAAYISLVSLVSMSSIHWYMSKTSLYLDLGFIFLAASSIYALILALDNDSTRANFLVLGMNLAILALSKEFGIFQAWLIIVIFIFLRYRGTFHNWLWSLIQSLLLLAPFMIRLFNYIMIYSFSDIDIVGPVITFQCYQLIAFLFILMFTVNRIDFQGTKLDLSRLIIVIAPLFVSALFFAHNFYSLGAPLPSLTEQYLERLLELDIVFAPWKPTNVSFLKIIDVFLSNTLMAMNLVPLLFFLFALILSRFHMKRSWPTNLLSSWFFYALFIFYYESFGIMEGALIRRILPLAIPLALIVGQGVHYLLRYSSCPDWIGTVTYTSATSLSLAYLWFVELDSTKWWMVNLHSLTTNFAKASYLEAILYSTPWLLLILVIVSKRRFGQSKIFSNKFWSMTGIILLLVSAVTPIAIFNQSIRYTKNWNPSYYDEADSVKTYANHWYIPILDLYRSRLNDNNSTTIGFGVTPLEYFLERPFIDLNHPRNWLAYLPLFQELSKDALISYLESLDARYFLIPTEEYHGRNRYEAALKNSTLFKLISTSEVFTGTDGQMHKFEKLAIFIPLELYVLKCFPSWTPIEMDTGEYYSNYKYDSYELSYDKELDQIVGSYKINVSIVGWRALHYSPTIPLDLTNVETIILGIKSSSLDYVMEFRIASERPWENFMGWRFHIKDQGWHFYEFKMGEPTPDLVRGEFDPANVEVMILGITLKSIVQKDIQFFYTILLPAYEQ